MIHWHPVSVATIYFIKFLTYLLVLNKSNRVCKRINSLSYLWDSVQIQSCSFKYHFSFFFVILDITYNFTYISMWCMHHKKFIVPIQICPDYSIILNSYPAIAVTIVRRPGSSRCTFTWIHMASHNLSTFSQFCCKRQWGCPPFRGCLLKTGSTEVPIYHEPQ